MHRRGRKKASGARVRSAWGGFGKLAPVLADRERERRVFGAALIPVFGECWFVVVRVRRAGLGWFRHVRRPVLARMPDKLCVFGVTDVKRL